MSVKKAAVIIFYGLVPDMADKCNYSLQPDARLCFVYIYIQLLIHVLFLFSN